MPITNNRRALPPDWREQVETLVADAGNYFDAGVLPSSFKRLREAANLLERAHDLNALGRE